jgi:putative thiamine transport system substrate-binding protein
MPINTTKQTILTSNTIRSSLKKALLLSSAILTTSAFADDWQQDLEQAKGQTVYFHAWGGSQAINDYIAWAGEQVKEQYDVTVKHVKADAAVVVQRIKTEKEANVTEGGKVDLMWINGENFKAMKANDLLTGPFATALPNYQYVDTENKPTTELDFGVPTDGLESPWGMAQLVFYYDSEQLEKPPTSMTELAKLAENDKGRIAYPAPPAFHGTTFLKQALVELTADADALSKPVDDVDFAAVTAPLWDYLDNLHPNLWQAGKNFPKDGQQMKQLVNDGELIVGISFNPNEASRAVANGELPETIKSYVHSRGTIGNTHFVAIPFNASAKAGAKVFANFLLSPEAQTRKANTDIWGDPTVLAIDKLSTEQQQAFAALPVGSASLSPAELGAVLPEPHASWVAALEAAWLERYNK